MLCLELGHIEDFLFNDDPKIRRIAVTRDMTSGELCGHWVGHTVDCESKPQE